MKLQPSVKLHFKLAWSAQRTGII